MKKSTIKKLAALAVVAAIAFAVYKYAFASAGVSGVNYKTANIEKRDIVVSIEATGTVEPEDLVDVGARVSGEIVAFGKDKAGKEVDYGSEIAEGDIIALIDDEIPQSDLREAKAKLEQAKATKAQAQANLILCQTNLKQAERDWSRAKRLGVSEALSQASYDEYLSAWEQASAQIDVAKAQISQADAEISQAEAALKVAERNLEYCVIKAPVNGVIIDRIVNVGQTVVSNMSASSLFLIAKDLKKMEVWASVNEADIGSIYVDQPVEFTVDAFPNEKFEGKVGKIRLNATMSQNVVTYVVEVQTDNSNGRLLPYLTANLNFEVKRVKDSPAVPNAALRWKPDGKYISEKVDMANLPDGRKVWVIDGDKVRPVIVETGITDGTFTEIKNGLKLGDEVVTGIETSLSSSSGGANPFMPKMPARRKSGNNTTPQKK